jgi:thymidylate synthase
MESRGLDYTEGDLGPVYGFQWRHFGEDYQGKDKEYKGGIDQIKQIIHLLKTEPTSRRIILSAWNPMDLDKMSLPPCHVMTQFNVDGHYLDAQLYQRSGDMFLGVPFNIASYAFLLHILGKLTGYIPRYLHHVIGDCHIYKSHIDVVDKQLERVPLMMAKIEVGDIKDIDDVTEEDIKIVDYKCDNIIKAKMVV